MSLFALVLTVCSMQTGQCINYVPRLYTSAAVCRFDAYGVQQLRRAGPIFVRCVPTGSHS